MLRIAIASILFVSSSTHLFAQQNNNLFPDDPAQTLISNTNDALNNAQQTAQEAAQQVNQAAQQTVNTAKNTATETTNSWARALEPSQPAIAASSLSPTNLISRWNQGTKNFFEKTKKSLSPPALEPPKMSLPRPKGRVRKFFGEFTSRSGTSPKRTLLPSILPKRKETPPKPQTIQDFLGLDRPQ